MNNLFLDSVEFEKTGEMVYLEKDSTTWIKTIVSSFLREYPTMQDMPITLTWKKKDTNKGYGVGTLNIAGAQVPIIVNQWQVSPYDIILVNGQTYPLNTDILRTLMSESSPFKGVASSGPKGSVSIFNTQLLISPREVGQTPIKYASVNSFIDTIENVDKKAIGEMLRIVQENPAIKQGFVDNDTYDVIEKLATKKAQTLDTAMQSIVRGLEIDRQFVTEDSLGNKILKQANSSVDHIWSTDVTASEATSYETKTAELKESNDTPFKGTVGVFIADNDKTMLVYEDKTWIIKEAHFDYSSSGLGSTSLEGDQPHVGDMGIWELHGKVTAPFEISNIYKTAEVDSVNEYKINGTDDSLFINKEGEWFRSPTAHNDTHVDNFTIEGVDPKVRDYGAWVTNDSISEPFEIISMQKIAEIGQWEITGSSGLKMTKYYPIRTKSEELVEKEKNAYYVPGSARFVKLNKQVLEQDKVEIMKQAAELAAETSAICIEGTVDLHKVAYYLERDCENKSFVNHQMYEDAIVVPDKAKFIKLGKKATHGFPNRIKENIHNVYKDSAGLYRLVGSEFDKYAERHEIRDLQLNDAIWSLIHCNVATEDLNKLASMHYGETLDLTSEPKAPLPIEEVAKAVEKSYAKHSAKIATLNINLVKEASVLNNKGSVDAVLSLGLLKKSNALEYSNLVPQYEMVMSDMAKLLLATRLGMQQVPEEAVKTAMLALADVVTVLKQIGAVNK